MDEITAPELAQWLADSARDRPLLVDVREPWEYALCRIEGSLHIPLKEVPQRLSELDPEQDIVTFCHHGMRSLQAASYLARQGFSRVQSLQGGIDAWAKNVDPKMARY